MVKGQETPGCLLRDDPRFAESHGIGTGAAVQDRNLLIIQFHKRIVDTKAGQGRHQVFDGYHRHVLAGQRGAAGGIGNKIGQGRKLGFRTQVGPMKNDSAVYGAGMNRHMGNLPGVQSFPFK